MMIESSLVDNYLNNVGHLLCVLGKKCRFNISWKYSHYIGEVYYACDRANNCVFNIDQYHLHGS